MEQVSTPSFGPSCTEFVFPIYLHLNNEAMNECDVLFEHCGQLHILSHSYSLIFCGTPPLCLKFRGLNNTSDSPIIFFTGASITVSSILLVVRQCYMKSPNN